MLYFLQVHLLYATLVALGAWALTSLRGASVTVKFWICTAASLNFVVPLGCDAQRLNQTQRGVTRPQVSTRCEVLRGPDRRGPCKTRRGDGAKWVSHSE